MEIYNEKAYDLLNEDHLVSPIEQWNKVVYSVDDHQQKINTCMTGILDSIQTRQLRKYSSQQHFPSRDRRREARHRLAHDGQLHPQAGCYSDELMLFTFSLHFHDNLRRYFLTYLRLESIDIEYLLLQAR